MKKIIFISIIFLIIILIFVSIVLSLSACKKSTSEQLEVYVWEGYLPEEAVNLFEQETGIELNITFATGTAMMLTLLKGGGKADIVMPTHSHVNRFYEADLAQPLDLTKITNFEKVSKSLVEQPWAKWDGSEMGSGEIYVIPYVFGTSGLVINTSKYTKNLDDVGWEILFDKSLQGRVSSKNNVDSLWVICYLLDIPKENLINDTQNTLEQIREKAIELKNNVPKFYNTGSEIIDLMKNEEVWVSYITDGGGRKLAQFDAKFKYILPKTGGMGWADTFMIPKNSTNPAGANLFINFMLRPEIARILTEQSGCTTTVKGALDMANGINKDLYKFTDDELEKLIWPPNLSEEARSISSAFWEELSVMQ